MKEYLNETIQTMNSEQRVAAFVALGRKLTSISVEEKQSWALQARANNNWFTYESIEVAINGIITYVQEDALKQWLSQYTFSVSQKRVGVVMAGNIPAVGFHDFLCVLLSGHILYAKLSSQDTVLLKKIAQLLLEIESEFSEQMHFADRLNHVEAIIATGSDNSSRYFKYYFGKVPNIIRQNRTSCAILTGQESKKDFEELGEDIFLYFGLGCRNISKLYVPENYNFTPFFDSIKSFSTVAHHHKYVNNYDYNKSILLVNNVPHQDNGFLLLTQNTALVSPVSVIYFEHYKNNEDLKNKIAQHTEKIQCIVSKDGWFPESISFGQAQHPQVWEYADKADTMLFLASLS